MRQENIQTGATHTHEESKVPLRLVIPATLYLSAEAVASTIIKEPIPITRSLIDLINL